MTQDEGRFGRVSIPKACWAPSGIRPNVCKQIVRESFFAYCAVAPSIGKISSLLLPYANTDMMSLFLENVSNEFKDNQIIMQVDRAGWHRSVELKIPKNIFLIQQPPYSPEVNPTEHIWEEIREKYLYNRIFDSIDDTMEAVCRGLIDLANKPDYVKSMTFFPHLHIA